MKSFPKDKRFAIIGLLAVIIIFNPISEAHGYWSMDRNGNMIQYKSSSNQVLGEEDNKEDEEEKETEEIKIENTDNLTESDEEKETKELEITKSNEIKQNQIESVEIHKSEPENEEEVEDVDKIEASDEGDIEIDIRKIDKKELKEKQESFEMETENGDKVHIELSPEKNQFEIRKNGVSASIELPLSVDPLLKKLVIATADGNKTLESLPDEVINNLKMEKKLGANSKIKINLQIENGQIIYHVKEVRHKKIAGIIPIDLTKNLSVSDSTWAILSEQESFLTKILNIISI